MARKVNITLSADEEVVRKARRYASSHNTTLNQLVRDFMGRLSGDDTPKDAASEFERIAREHASRSPEGYRFDRDELHQRQA